jgi:hypothetical protein
MSEDPRLRALGVEPEAADESALELVAADGDAADVPAVLEERPRSDVEALKDGSAMLLSAGNRVAALALLWSAVAIDPLDLGAHRRLAAMLANAGDDDGAANEYARYIDFLLPMGEVGRAAMELQYGAKMLGAHPAMHDAAEKIAAAIRALVPFAADATALPTPRLLPRVPFRFCIHDDGKRHWMQLEGGTEELLPVAVRLLDRNDNVIETRKCIALAPGQKGHARVPEGEKPGVAWVVVGVSDEFVAALEAGQPLPHRFEAKVGDEWFVVTLTDTACRLGRRAPKAVVS